MNKEMEVVFESEAIEMLTPPVWVIILYSTIERIMLERKRHIEF